MTPPAADHSVIFDLVAAQSPSYRGRGIARYSTDLLRAVTTYYPELVHSIVVHPDLAPLEGLEGLEPWLTTRPDWSSASVLHLSSVFEPEVAVQEFWPRAASASGLLVAATLYDLIPDIFPQWYLEDPGLRRRWRCCREVARTADAVLTLSECARSDTIDMLGVPPGRVHVIGSGCSDVFRPAASPEAAWKLVQRAVRGLRPGFLIYNGAFNPRKNVDGLIAAYAALPRYLIDRHQLVVVCHARPLERNHYLVMADRLGLHGRLLVPGFVADEVLVGLYQCAALNVFPSLYEGFGLPVVEAMACGAPTLAAANSSLVEILPPYALFDASDPGAMSEAIVKALTDPVQRARLEALTRRDPPSWADVAHRAAAVLTGLVAQAARHRPAWRRRPQLALVGVPAGLAGAIGRRTEADRFAWPEPDGDEVGGQDGGAGAGGRRRDQLGYGALARLDHWRAGYDAIVTWWGEGHEGVLADVEQVARRWDGRTLALVEDGRPGTPEAVRRLGRAGARVVRVVPGSEPEGAARLLFGALGEADG